MYEWESVKNKIMDEGVPSNGLASFLSGGGGGEEWYL